MSCFTNCYLFGKNCFNPSVCVHLSVPGRSVSFPRDILFFWVLKKQRITLSVVVKEGGGVKGRY